MTSIDMSPALDYSGERQQGDVAGLLDGVAQAALARSAYARDAARNDLTPLGDERVQHLDVLVIDVVDLLDAEPASFLAPEILLLLRNHELDHRLGNAQPALHLVDCFRTRCERDQHVASLAMLIHAVRQPALAPLFHLVYGSARGADDAGHLLDDLVDLFFRRVRFDDEQ